MKEEIILDIAELIQDYFVWVAANPIDAARLDDFQTLSAPRTINIHHSDLLGFSRWLARGAATPPQDNQAE